MSIPGQSTRFANLVLHDKRKAAPRGFEFVSDLLDSRSIDLEIGIRGCNTAGLVKRLHEISTPGRPSFRKHLSKEEAESYARPTAEAIKEVKAWLDHHKIQFESISPSGDRLRITVPVGKANQMLNTTFSVFRRTESQTESFQTLSYSLPSVLKDIIESIEPTTSFPRPPFRPTVKTLMGGIDFSAIPSDNKADRNKLIEKYGITPERLAQRYGIPTEKVTQTNNLAVPAFGLNYANRNDLKKFLENFRNDLNGATFTEQSVDEAQNRQVEDSPYQEGNLDIQYTVGLVNFSPVVLVSGTNTVNGFTNVINHLLKQENPPTVVSISYGFQEEDLAGGTMRTMNNLFLQLTARGVSILVSTGDGGVAGSCWQTSSSDSTPSDFIPTFPASCPYVTAVGATALKLTEEFDIANATEIGAPFSAGGFSNHFRQPLYQRAAVKGYLNQIGSLYEGLFNPTGRAFPDVSALGENIVVVKNQLKDTSGGTSASAPIFASTIALLNDRLCRKGKPVLGFLNPLLYMNPEAFNDIIEGNNPGCGTEGFFAKPGWDPVTGLGSPMFERMAKILRV